MNLRVNVERELFERISLLFHIDELFPIAMDGL